MEESFHQKVIQNLTAKLAGLEQQNSMLFVEVTDLRIENTQLKQEKSNGKHLHKDK